MGILKEKISVKKFLERSLPSLGLTTDNFI